MVSNKNLKEILKTILIVIFFVGVFALVVIDMITPDIDKVVCTPFGNISTTSSISDLFDKCTTLCRIDTSFVSGYYNQTCLDKCYIFIRSVGRDVR